VCRIRGPGECIEVAPFARLRGSRKPARDVTRVALETWRVRTCQRELGARRVIEHCAFPLRAGMAKGTVPAETQHWDVIRVFGDVEILGVATGTLRGRAGVLAAHMAGTASEPCMCAR